ncbi:MAG: hypothetical protein E5V81_06845 [Mesorhizobium sp.]|nr:MAG: hypothetical protein E5V81_06845 [Mesorhizobium sp.]
MGGTSGEVRGKSKVETYLKYFDLCAGIGSMMEGRNPDPAFKKYTKRQMVQDSETGEWVLYYHLHT